MSGISNITQSTERSPDIKETQGQRVGRQDRAKAVEETRRTGQKSGLTPEKGPKKPDMDEYVHEEEPVSAGVYRSAKDEDGNSVIIFNDPARKTADHSDQTTGTKEAAPGQAESEKISPDQGKTEEVPQNPGNPEKVPQESEEPKAAPDKGGDGKEKCTVNTDKVDEEIRKLKQKQRDLEQQIARSEDDPDKQKELEQQLMQVERELRMKDTDSYRRQHSKVTNG